MPSHRATEDWMGDQVVTLEDLLAPGLRAVCVGINPSQVSVDAGHYYQGRVGQRFFARLDAAGVIPNISNGFEDDCAFETGVGFTDIVKRPTARADAIRAEELEHGKPLLLEKLEEFSPRLVIFTFKKTAEVLLGRFDGNGHMHEMRIGDSEVFVMPGPYERLEKVNRTLTDLAAMVDDRSNLCT